MTAAELTETMRALDLTQLELATTLDMSPRTIRRYLSGVVPIPHVVALAMTTVVDVVRRSRRL